MKQIIYRTLNELGVPFGMLGRDYIESAVELILRKGRLSMTKELYPLIAKAIDTTPICVERAIRFAIEKTFDAAEPKRLEDFFGNTVSLESCKLTNSDFIYAIVKRITVFR